MCPWVGPHAPSFRRQLWGLPSRVGYLSPQGVLLPLVYGTTASPLWFELRGPSAWQATPSWTVYRLACHRLLPLLRVTFAMFPDAACPGSDQWPWSTAPAPGQVGPAGRPAVSNPWCVGSFLSPVRPMCVRCPGPLGSCSPVRSRGLLCRVCGVLGHLAPVHQCARSVCCFACEVSRASWLLFTGVPGSGVPSLCCPRCTRVCGVLALVAPVHRCARCVRCACAIGGCVPLPPPLMGRAYTAGTGTGSWCGGAIVLCPLACVVGAMAAVAPQGCGSRVLMYTGMGQGGFG